MSLLNDALKKAQKMQGQQRPGFPSSSQTQQRPAEPQPTAAPVQPAAATPVAQPQPTEKSGPNVKAILGITLATFVVLAGALGVGGYFLFSKATETAAPELAQAPQPQTPSEPAPVAAPEAPEPVAQPPQPVEVAAPAPQPAAAAISAPVPVSQEPAEVIPVVPQTDVSPEVQVAIGHAGSQAEQFEEASGLVAQPEPQAIGEPVAPAAVEAPVITAPVVRAQPVATTEADGVIIEAVYADEPSLISSAGNHPDPQIEGWVAQITVSGVRMGSSPKVLMNDRVYQAGEVVNKNSGLKLIAIESRLLQFADPDGNTYQLRF